MLGDVAWVLRLMPEITVEIGGHTDSNGGADDNEALSQRRLVAIPDIKPLRVILRGEMPVGRRVPDLGVDAIQDSAQDLGAVAQQAFQPHAHLAALDLDRVGRRDGGEVVGERQAALQKADPAVVFDAIDGESVRRQAQRLQQVGRKLPLECDVVDGDDGCRPATLLRACEAEIDRSQRGLPIVRMYDVERIAARSATTNLGRRISEGAKALGVVAPIRAMRILIWTAGTSIEVRRVQDQQREPGRLGRDQCRRSAEQILPAVHDLGAGQPIHDLRITWQQGGDGDAERRQREGQRTGDIREAAGLDQREDFGRDRQDAQIAHAARRWRLLIIWVVIRQMPFSVRRKRRASSSGSSPTTRPSGMCTPRSTTTFFSRTCWPISA